MICLAQAKSCGPGAEGSGEAGWRSLAAMKTINVDTAPTLARKNRGASPRRLNRHHRSAEYSTCLCANNPSQMDPPTTTAMLTIQVAVKVSLHRTAFR